MRLGVVEVGIVVTDVGLLKLEVVSRGSGTVQGGEVGPTNSRSRLGSWVAPPEPGLLTFPDLSEEMQASS